MTFRFLNNFIRGVVIGTATAGILGGALLWYTRDFLTSLPLLVNGVFACWMVWISTKETP